MKRLIPFAVLAIVAVATLPTTAAAPKSHWRELNADLAPVNVALQTDAQAFGLAYTDAGQDMQNLFFSSALAVDDVTKAAAKLQKDEARIKASLQAIKADARKGIDVLDSYAPEQCSFHFTGSEYAMFAAWLDVATSWLNGVDSGAVSTAIYLDGLSGVDLSPLPAGGPLDLEWSHVTCVGAEPSAAPPSPSAGAS